MICNPHGSIGGIIPALRSRSSKVFRLPGVAAVEVRRMSILQPLDYSGTAEVRFLECLSRRRHLQKHAPTVLRFTDTALPLKDHRPGREISLPGTWLLLKR